MTTDEKNTALSNDILSGTKFLVNHVRAFYSTYKKSMRVWHTFFIRKVCGLILCDYSERRHSTGSLLAAIRAGRTPAINERTTLIKSITIGLHHTIIARSPIPNKSLRI